MELIAKRSNTNLWIYGTIALSGLAVIILAIVLLDADLLIIMMGLLIMLICGFLCKSILSVPKEIISLDDDNMLVLHFCDKKISPSALTDISYHRAGHQSLPYRFGTLTICSNSGDFTCKHVDNVAEVSRILTDLMYEHNPRKKK